jgi:hypothetical protein
MDGIVPARNFKSRNKCLDFIATFSSWHGLAAHLRRDENVSFNNKKLFVLSMR